MKSIIFYFLILIFNLNILSASDKWNFSLLKKDNTEHKSLVNELHKSLNQLEENKLSDVTTHLINIKNGINKLKNIDNYIVLQNNFYNLSISHVKKLFETFLSTQFANQKEKEKKKTDLDTELAKLKQDYLNELKEKCHTFLNPQPQKKELQQSEQIQSDLRDTWDFSQMNQGSVYDGKREELENLLTRHLNKGDAEIVLNDQFKTIAKLVTQLNIKAQGSYSFWNNKQNPNDFNLIKQSLASLAKKLKKHAGEALSSSSDSNDDDEYVSFNEDDNNSDQETENPPVTENNSSVTDSVNNQSTVISNPKPEIIISKDTAEKSTPLKQKMVNDLLQDLSKVNSFSDLNQKNLYGKNPTSIPKDPNSKPNKSTWFKPKIIFGVALFSITVYWFLKNYLFGKNPA